MGHSLDICRRTEVNPLFFIPHIPPTVTTKDSSDYSGMQKWWPRRSWHDIGTAALGNRLLILREANDTGDKGR